MVLWLLLYRVSVCGINVAGDGLVYLKQAHLDVLSLEFWTAVRRPLYPLFLLVTGYAPVVAVVAQSVCYVLATALFVRVVVWQAPVVVWLRVGLSLMAACLVLDQRMSFMAPQIMSETLYYTLIAALLLAILGPLAALRMRMLLGLTLAIVLLRGEGFIIALLLLPAMLWRVRQENADLAPSRSVVIISACVMFAVLAMAHMSQSKLTVHNAVRGMNVAFIRAAQDPNLLAFYADKGMPIAEWEVRKGWSFFEQERVKPGFKQGDMLYDWLTQKGVSVYAEYILKHPWKAFDNVGGGTQDFRRYDAYRADSTLRDALSNAYVGQVAHYRLVAERMPWLERFIMELSGFGFWLLTAGFLSILALVRWPETRDRAVLLGLVGGALWAGSTVAYLADALDGLRHQSPYVFALNLWMLAVVIEWAKVPAMLRARATARPEAQNAAMWER